ncbi:MerR family transcriptional regulator [Opitutus sp. GAS368]|jgi:DNA-binding transcriptional MerR regulator|uniref:MerR family transcriptional regulator n=1 Tax=Opitutus sp. GAS368 TaxID=1882749 RepID=UPI00087B80DE|nr:MerR family transcriptional regulator [Opitutus sp. GAS368]SDR66735.1 MerR HTH family regulatory protein [Opitutus sp. GAS368]
MTNFIFYVNPTLTLACRPAGTPALHSLAAAADLTGVHPEILQHYCRLGLLGAQRAGSEPTFDDNALYEVRRIEHYRRHHGVTLQALPLFCALSREVERLQTEVRFLRGP